MRVQVLENAYVTEWESVPVWYWNLWLSPERPPLFQVITSCFLNTLGATSTSMRLDFFHLHRQARVSYFHSRMTFTSLFNIIILATSFSDLYGSDTSNRPSATASLYIFSTRSISNLTWNYFKKIFSMKIIFALCTWYKHSSGPWVKHPSTVFRTRLIGHRGLQKPQKTLLHHAQFRHTRVNFVSEPGLIGR